MSGMRRPVLALVAAALLVDVDGKVAESYKRDWSESPLLGQNTPPPGVETPVYLSVYVERLLDVSEKLYTFDASMLYMLAWRDPRAYYAVGNATAAVAAGGTCARLCSYSDELAPADAPCCGGDLWLPSLRFRNIVSLSGGRDQIFQITVTPDNVVVWRIKFTGTYYTSLNFKAFPFDRQTLDIHMVTTNATERGGTVKFVASATGDRIFEMGEGSDNNGWNVDELLIWQSRHTFASLFVDKNNFRRSARADPAPLIPALNDSLVTTPFGADLYMTDITASIIVSRQSSTYVLGIIFPTIAVVFLALLTFLLPVDMISTRLSTASTMFLTLVAVSWVSEGFTPKASYPLPTRILLMLAYAAVIVIALETIAVMAIRNGVSISERARRVRAGRNEYVGNLWTRLRRNRAARRAGGTLPTASGGGVSMAGAAAGGGTGMMLADGDAKAAGDGANGTSASDTARDAKDGFNAWLADTLDFMTFILLIAAFSIGAALIFVVAQARQPGLCEMSGAPAGCIDQLGRA